MGILVLSSTSVRRRSVYQDTAPGHRPTARCSRRNGPCKAGGLAGNVVFQLERGQSGVISEIRSEETFLGQHSLSSGQGAIAGCDRLRGARLVSQHTHAFLNQAFWHVDAEWQWDGPHKRTIRLRTALRPDYVSFQGRYRYPDMIMWGGRKQPKRLRRSRASPYFFFFFFFFFFLFFFFFFFFFLGKISFQP